MEIKTVGIKAEKWNVDAFTYTNGSYYFHCWYELPYRKSFAGWNLVTLLFGFQWLIYRRLYKEAWIYFGIRFFIKILPLPYMVSCTLLFALMWSLPIIANALYRIRFFKALSQTEYMDDDERDIFLEKKGGTDPATLFVVIAIIVLLSRILPPFLLLF